MKVTCRLLLGWVLLMLSAINSLACSCPQIGTFEDMFRWKVKSHLTVFSGEVINVVKKDKSTEFTFRVDQFWKGVDNEEIVVSTDHSSCAYGFEPGEKYLVLAAVWEGLLSTGSCSGNRPLEKADKELKILGEGKTPEKKKQ
jgi:hypothetical protein